MGTTPKRDARPKPNEIDPEQVLSLAKIGATTEEIADHFYCSTKHIERNFQAQLTAGRVLMKQSLRQKQMKVALEGDRTMLIWLGKQMLHQTDKQEQTTIELKPKKQSKKKIPKDIYE